MALVVVVVALIAWLYYFSTMVYLPSAFSGAWDQVNYTFPIDDWRNRTTVPWTNTDVVGEAVEKFDVHVSAAELEDLDNRLANYRGWGASTPMNHSDDEHWTSVSYTHLTLPTNREV